MRPFICILSLALCGSLHAAQFKIGGHQFTLPEGFDIELVADTNLVLRPIEADFDELGRLYVTESSGSNDKVEKQLAEKPHRVVRLEDTDGDGRFDKSLTFADKMMLPQGAMWLDGSLYVAAPPSIWKLTDTNSDGVADVRVEWFKGKTLTGCANDLHGPYAGPDGWIYWCKGAFAKQTYTLPNGKEFTTRASHIFRARPDGAGIEPVMTGGMDNPVGLAFTPEGERIVSGTFFLNPEGGKRDGLIHAIYGGVYGKPNDALEGHPRTGDLMPIMTHLGPAAPAGLMRYESEVFGSDFQNNLFTACFNLHKVTRHVIAGEGATYRTTDEDFLVSDNTDFHPTDVFEDADGSIIIVDTGGWYKLCCPTSQLHKPDVLGGIYRIRRRNALRLEDPYGRRLAWPELKPQALVELLGDARPAVRRRAVRQLGKLGDAAVPALATAVVHPGREFQAIWALTHIDSPGARQAVRTASKGRSGPAFIAAIHSASAWRDTNALAEAVAGLKAGSPHLARASAEALGRFGDRRAVPDLLATAKYRPDRLLEHGLIYALIEIADSAATAVALTSEEPLERRLALMALDQMSGGGLKPEQVIPLLSSTNTLLKETARWIVGHHPEWGSEMAKHLKEQIASAGLSDDARSELQQLLAQHAQNGAIQGLLAATARDSLAPAPTRLIALRAMSAARLKETPPDWTKALTDALDTDDAAVRSRAIAAIRTLPRPKGDGVAELTAALSKIVEDEQLPAELRLEAAAATPGIFTKPSSNLYLLVWRNLTPERPVAVRRSAAEVFAKSRFSDKEMVAFAQRVGSYSPLDINRILSGFANSTHETVGLTLLGSLKNSKLLPAVQPDTLKASLTNFPPSVHTQAETLLASLNTDAAQQKKHIEELLMMAKGGDVRRGQAIFNSTKAACAACHAIGYLGGKVGPDLTRIGQVRNERDLLEAIVYPNASFVRSYEPMIVATKSDEEFSGVLRKDAADEVVLATGPNTEQRIARADITDMRPGSVSIMPSGLAEQLGKEELADLLAFLKATRW